MSIKTQYNGLVDEIGTLSEKVRAIWDAAGDEPLTGEQKQEVIDTNKRIEEKEVEAKELLEQIGLQAESRRAAALNRLPNGAGGEKDASARPRGPQILRPSDALFDAPEFKEFLGRVVSPSGHVIRQAFGHSPAVQAKLLTGASPTSAGALVDVDRTRIVDPGPLRQDLTVRSLVTNGQTSSDMVEYVRVTGETNNAAPVAEATNVSGSSGVKPMSDMALAVVQEAVKTVAHWVPATRRALSDAGQLRTLIDNFLRFGLEEVLEDQMINGDGTGENFTGILNTPNLGSQAYTTDLLVTTRKARTKVRTEGRARATAYAMNPADWEALDLLTDAEDRYYFGGPMVMGTPRLWGLPVVETEALDAGVALVADWRMAVLWDREDTQIMVSDSHADFFVRNLIAILAEMRAAFGVIRPQAFIEIDLTS